MLLPDIEIDKYLEHISLLTGENKNLEILVAATSVLNYMLPEKSRVSQDVSEHIQGAYTAQVSAIHLAKACIGYSFVGHSETMSLSDWSYNICASKLKCCFANGITPILFISEDRRSCSVDDIINSVLARLHLILDILDHIGKFILVYEPVSAIGTGKVDTKLAELVRQKLFALLLQKNLVDKVDICYGGSVSSDNISLFEKNANFKGYVIGKASLNIGDVSIIVNKMQEKTFIVS